MSSISEQRYFFICSLPRTGTTLLSVMLNQNPDIFVSPSGGDTHLLLRAIERSAVSDKPVLFTNSAEQRLSLLRNALQGMHQTRSQRYIFENSVAWGNPYYSRMLNYIFGEKPKIVALVRPLNQIVASLVNKLEENPDNYVDKEMVEYDFLPYWRKPLNDARVDYLLREGGPIQIGMLSLHEALNGDSADCFHLIEYSDLVLRPQETMRGLYDFLEIPHYPHSYGDLSSDNIELDTQYLGIPDMHTTRPTLKVTSLPPENVLSDYALKRCELEDFWTQR